MRYIKKGKSPDFFEQATQDVQHDPIWKNLRKKTELRLHLIAEQRNLCAYCERGINQENSHIEHIIEQSNQPELRFDYQNLIASCNGDLCNSELKKEFHPEDVHSCGHKKDSGNTDVNLFLNPVAVQDIGEYFSYIKETGFIVASEKDIKKAKHTIELLNLDNPRLNKERLNAPDALLQIWLRMKDMPNAKYDIKNIRQLLAKERPFISFLRFYYAAFL